MDKFDIVPSGVDSTKLCAINFVIVLFAAP